MPQKSSLLHSVELGGNDCDFFAHCYVRFGDETRHLILNDTCNPVCLVGAHSLQDVLHRIHPDIFRRLHDPTGLGLKVRPISEIVFYVVILTSKILWCVDPNDNFRFFLLFQK